MAVFRSAICPRTPHAVEAGSIRKKLISPVFKPAPFKISCVISGKVNRIGPEVPKSRDEPVPVFSRDLCDPRDPCKI